MHEHHIGIAAPLPGEHVISSAELPEDLSPWGMFKNSDLVVKAVIIGLALASLVTWTVWLAKTLELRAIRRSVPNPLSIFASTAVAAAWCWAGSGCYCRDWLWRLFRAWAYFHSGCWWLERLLSWALLGRGLNGTRTAPLLIRVCTAARRLRMPAFGTKRTFRL
jgi:hypothetical protein